ncbi:hypothetical protein EDF48_11222 [Curtobacterium sp. PhB191]|uniref:ArsR family transcriptional regulator n=1 Tax=Curtobacterium sp. PhB191 TaxID=2485202 RepID=UPI00104CBC1C|nr:ArsR family transcriptional regulator [Curtobacterium sp. PhB191]TCU82270.1 hypothetical protein EDF48_11222 [Curtobacterium sp. PhB191]
MTRLSARGYTQIRHILVQLPERDKPRAATLAKVMHERKHRALLLYILLLTCWPWLQEQWKPLEGSVWIRALTAKGAPTWSASTLSRAWADLVELGLVEKNRENRLVRVVPRREDGGAEYDAPGGRRDGWNRYFSIPDAFWNDEIFAKLNLSALVMFLVVAKETSRQSSVWLTYDDMEKWYGIKPKSAQNGLTELRQLGLVKRTVESIDAPLAPDGKTVHMHYALTNEFGYESRKALQDRAKKAIKKRQKKLKKSDPTQGTEAP